MSTTAAGGVALAADWTRPHAPAPDGAPSWLAARRADAAGWIERHGFPNRKDEDWRYLDLAGLLAVPFQAAPESGLLPGTGALGGQLPGALGFDLGGPRLVFVNGQLAPGLCRLAERPDQAGVGSVAAALSEQPSGLEAAFASGTAEWYHGFDALNAVLATDGAFLRIPAGVHVDAPVHLVFLSLPGAAPQLASPRSVILAGAGSAVSLVATHAGWEGAPVCTNTVMEIRCEEGARVDYDEVQDAPETAYHLSLLDVHQAAGSQFSARTVTLGGALARHEVRVTLAGEGAKATLDGLYLPARRQYHDHPVLVDHATAGATSRQCYQGVIAGRGHGVFNGHIVVRPGADRTDAEQTNKNLLLSEWAEIDTRPRLEIHADDVRCTHGAAVGQIDAEALFYLRSRGIPRQDAERILVAAFAGELIGRIPHEAVRAYVDARIAERSSTQEDGRQ